MNRQNQNLSVVESESTQQNYEDSEDEANLSQKLQASDIESKISQNDMTMFDRINHNSKNI